MIVVYIWHVYKKPPEVQLRGFHFGWLPISFYPAIANDFCMAGLFFASYYGSFNHPRFFHARNSLTAKVTHSRKVRASAIGTAKSAPFKPQL